MKKILSIAALIVVILAFLPLVSGLVAKNRFENLTAELQVKYPNLQISSNYHLGWLSSEATLSWNVNASGAEWPAIQHEVIIHHGPIAFFHDEQGRTQFFFGVAVLDVQLPVLSQSNLLTINFQKKIFSAIIRIPFDLHYAVAVHAALHATVNLAKQPLLSLNLDQLRLESNFTHDLSRVKGEFLVQNFTINANDRGYLTLPSIQVNLNNHREEGVYLGNETIAIPSIDLSLPPMLQFKLQDFHSSFVGAREKTAISYQVNLGVNGATYNDQNYGPLTFDFQVNRLNFKTLAQMEEKIQAYAKQRTLQPENTEDLQNALAEDLKKLLPGLVQKDTEIALKQLDLSLPNGNVHSQGTLSFASVPTSININTLMQDVELYYHLAMNKSLAESFITDIIDRNIGVINNQIGPNVILGQLANLGLLRENNDTYNLDIQIKQGVITVNQQPFNAALLQQAQMALTQPEVLTPPAVAAPKTVVGETTVPAKQ